MGKVPDVCVYVVYMCACVFAYVRACVYVHARARTRVYCPLHASVRMCINLPQNIVKTINRDIIRTDLASGDTGKFNTNDSALITSQT